MRNLFLYMLAAIALSGCDSAKRMEARGYAQGSTYSIIYFNDGTDLQYQVDSILVAYDRALSTYQPNSYISKWNNGTLNGAEQPQWFADVVNRSLEVTAATEGAFDITVKPLMDFWFGRKWDAAEVDSSQVDSLRALVGPQHLSKEGDVFVKDDARVQLDVNAIAQGHSVDVVADYLQQRGAASLLVEIGGEVYAKGMKPDGTPWTVGIDRPSADGNPDRDLALSVRLTDKGLATSGNYRKFVEVNGKKLGHSLNPRTGYPATTDVLSATIIAPDAATADAFATACMVMGLARSKQFITDHPDLEGVLIYSEKGEMLTWISKGIPELIKK
jgi:thiamine biosynthesis lipoprotein